MKYNRIFAALAGLIAVCTALAGCASAAPAMNAEQTGSGAAAATITLNGGSASVQGKGAAVQGTVITISDAGTYRITGTLDDGQIVIDAGKDDAVTLVLDNADISCSDSAGIYAKQAGITTLLLQDGTQNSVSDAAQYAYPDGGDEPDAAIFAKDDLTIAGSGTLTVTGSFNNAIGSKDNLLIESGTLIVTAANDGLRGRDSVTITDGNFTIDAQGDGIKSNNDEDAEKGWITLSGGVYQITAGNDGIQAETDMTITGGTYTIVTGGGSANAPARKTQDFGGGRPGTGMADGFSAGGMTPPEGMQAPPNSETISPGSATAVQSGAASSDGSIASAGPAPSDSMTPADSETAPPNQAAILDSTAAAESDTNDSMKGLKAVTSLTVSGGTFTIDSADDAVHSNGSLTVSGGTFAISTGDDAFHADGALVIDDGVIQIDTCYEGLEGAAVDINGGEIDLTASDDGVNAAGGSDGGIGGGFGQDRFAARDAYYIRITGGTLTVQSGGDGLDSNGNLYLDGGTTVINGPTSGADSALDFDGSAEMNGGTLIASGSSGMAQAPQDGTQAVLMVYFTETQPSGAEITLLDSAGETILSAAPAQPFQTLVLSAPTLMQGETYTLCVDGETLTSVTLSEQLTRVSSDGSEVNGMTGERGPGRDGGRMAGGMSGEAPLQG